MKISKSTEKSSSDRTKNSETIDTSRVVDFARHNGILTLHLHKKPIPALILDVDENQDPIAPCPIYRIKTLLPFWNTDGETQLSILDKRVTSLLKYDGSCHFFLQIELEPSDDWIKAHPAECSINLVKSNQDFSFVSWGSTLWKKEASSALLAFLRHIEKQHWANRCAGIQISAGELGGWRTHKADLLPDSSPCMAEKFRVFAIDRYRRNEGVLRKAWLDSRAAFKIISCPNTFERSRANVGILRNPSKYRKLLDYYECLGETRNELLLHFVSIIRKETRGRILLGVGLTDPSNSGSRPESAEGYPEAVLDSSDIDYIVAIREQSFSKHALENSARLRTKFVFRTVRSNEDPKTISALAAADQCGLMLPAGTHDLPALISSHQRLLRPGTPLRKRTAESAIILDPTWAQYVGGDEEQAFKLLSFLFEDQMRALQSLGVSIELHLMSDLFHPKFPEYSVHFFLNSFYLSEAERRQVDARIKRSGKTGVWFWGAGVIGEDSITGDLGKQVCGQKLRLETGPISLSTRTADTKDAITRGMHMGSKYGSEKQIAPILTVSDKNCIRLGANSNNKTVSSVIRHKEWTSVVFGTLPIPARVLQNILRESECHLTLENSAEKLEIAADSAILACRARNEIAANISLPGVSDVQDGYTGEYLATGLTQLAVNIKAEDAVFFLLKPSRKTEHFD